VGVDSYKDVKLFGTPVIAEIMADATDLSVFGDQQFDCVFSSHTLEHIEDYKAALLEWWRLVKPGGTLILYLPDRELYPHIGEPGANPDHKHDFDRQEIMDALRKAPGGWDLERNEKRSGGFEYSFLQVYRRRTDGQRLQSWKTPKPEKTAGIVRMGALGDALWSSSVIWHLKAQGYHVTVYTQEAGEVVLGHDPHIDRIIVIPDVYDGAGLLAYFCYEEPKYDYWLNLCGIVETRLLPASNEVDFWRPLHQRQAMFGRSNYLEALHLAANLPMEFHQKFYPTADEIAFAKRERAKLDGQVVVIAPSGSTISKFWPHVQDCIDVLDQNGIHSVVLGDLRGREFSPGKHGRIVGMEWDIRKALTFALHADVVVGTESAIVNAVAFEDLLKIVLLSHSSEDNLTKHWNNTIAIAPTAIPCYPCHRIHRTMEHCVQDKQTLTAICQAVVAGADVADTIVEYLNAPALEVA
jgi:ADP-heptose:LPS heptosyltransferase